MFVIHNYILTIASIGVRKKIGFSFLQFRYTQRCLGSATFYRTKQTQKQVRTFNDRVRWHSAG